MRDRSEQDFLQLIKSLQDEDEVDALLLMVAATLQEECVIVILHPILHFLRHEENRVKLSVFHSEHIDRLSLSSWSSLKADLFLFSWRMTSTRTVSMVSSSKVHNLFVWTEM